MPDLDEKLPPDVVPVPSGRDRLTGWFRHRRDAQGRRRWRWGRLGATAAGIAVLGYASLVTAAFGYFRYHRHIKGFSWFDLAVPSRRVRFHIAKGEKYLADARRCSDLGQWREAFMFTRSGLALAPANREGRLLLVNMLSASRGPAAARETLLAGLSFHGADPVYLREVFTRLFQLQEDAEVLTLARRGMAEHPPASAVAALCASAGATAAYFRGRFDEAEDVLRQVPGMERSRDGRLLGAKIEWERGYRELAIVQLKQLAHERPDDAEVHHEWVNRLRQLGRADEARRATLAFQIGHPQLPRPRIELFRAYAEAGENERLGRETEAFVRDFADDREALVALADFAANTANAALAQRLTRHATARGFALEPFLFCQAEAAVVAREYENAERVVAQFRREHPDAETRYRVLFDSLQAIARVGQGDAAGARLLLQEFLAHGALRAENLLAVANRLLALGATELAQQVLGRATEIDPHNQPALTRLIELEVGEDRTSALPGHLHRLLAMRRPSPDILRVAEIRLGSDLYIFSPEAQSAVAAVHAALKNSPGSGRVR